MITNKIKQLVVASPAKLNLFLQITGKKANGYHCLQTIFQLLNFSDIMHFKVNAKCNKIQLKSNNKDLEYKDNIIYQAISALKAIAPTAQGADIYLHKNIPIGGGMGGGSSNAATTLLVLNKLWNLNIDYNSLLKIATALGADVPVFVNGNNCFAEGIGEQLTPIELPKHWFLVVFPGVMLNTGKMFNHNSLKKDSTKIDYKAAIKLTENAFTNPVRMSSNIIDETINALNLASTNAIRTAAITGSGSCIFTTFNSYTAVLEAQKKLQINTNSRCFVTEGSKKSLLHLALNI